MPLAAPLPLPVPAPLLAALHGGLPGTMTDPQWFVTLAVAAIAGLGALAAISANLKARTHVHDLKVKVAALQRRHAMELRRIAGLEPDDLDAPPGDDRDEPIEVDEAPPADATAAPARRAA